MPELLDAILLDIQQNVCFMHDGAPGHCFSARNHLEIAHTGQQIGRQRPVFWPPDLNLLDFFPFGISKTFSVHFCGRYYRGSDTVCSKWL